VKDAVEPRQPLDVVPRLGVVVQQVPVALFRLLFSLAAPVPEKRYGDGAQDVADAHADGKAREKILDHPLPSLFTTLGFHLPVFEKT